MGLYKGIYRSQSTRLQHWDYTSPGYYFITICTYDKQNFLGHVNDGIMMLSEMGFIVEEEWLKTPQIRRNVDLDVYAILPNHFHGIIILTQNDLSLETSQRDVSTKQPGLAPNSLGSIIGQFKSKCTKRIRTVGHKDFRWQPRYYDHIIRNDQSLTHIRHYITHNALKWEYDRENNNAIPIEEKKKFWEDYLLTLK